MAEEDERRAAYSWAGQESSPDQTPGAGIQIILISYPNMGSVEGSSAGHFGRVAEEIPSICTYDVVSNLMNKTVPRGNGTGKSSSIMLLSPSVCTPIQALQVCVNIKCE